VTALFSDVVGSTALAERLDTETVTRVMDTYFGRMKAVVDRHGGTVAKFIGDAIVAVFGIPTLHEDDALRAARCALEMGEAVDLLNIELQSRWDVKLSTRTGVNTGEVLARRADPGGHVAVGDAMNLAARFEQSAQPGEIILGKATYLLLREAVEVVPLEPLLLKGKSGPVKAFRLIRVTPSAEAIPRRADSRMVGRKDARGSLEWVLQRAMEERSCRIVSVVGPAGVGKSRLVREFREGLVDACIVLQGRCLPYGEGITFWPLREAISQAATIDDQDDPHAASAKIVALLKDTEDAPRIADRVAQAIGLSDAAGPLQDTFWSIRKLLESIARTRPLVMVFDDLHWAEPTLLDLIRHIGEFSRGLPILLICLARPDLLETHQGWEGSAEATSITLDALTRAESDQLIQQLLGDARLPSQARDQIADAAGGNPLFVEQMVSMLIDDGVIRREDGRWIATSALSSASVPPTIQALVAARLERLSIEERQVLEPAAVVGQIFYVEAISEISPEATPDTLQAYLLALVRKDLVSSSASDFAGQEAFRFQHALIRDAVYHAIPKARRAELHRRFAYWLERVAGDRAPEYEGIVGYNLERAHRYRTELGPEDSDTRDLARQAADRLSAAGRRSLANGDMPAALNLLSRAAALLPTSDPSRPEVLLSLAEARSNVGEFERSDALLGEAIGAASVARDQRILAYATIARMRNQAHTDSAVSWEEISGEASRAIGVFEELGDEFGLAKAWRLKHWVAHILCHHAEAERAILQALHHSRRAGDPEQWGDLSDLVGTMLYGQTPVPAAIERCDVILTQVAGNPSAESFVLGSRGLLGAMRGEFDHGRDLIERSSQMAEDLGLRVMAASTRSSWLGQLELLAGDPAEAEREFRRGCDVLAEMGEKNFLSTLAARLAQALYALARYDEAEHFARTSQQTAAGDDIVSQVIWRCALAKVLARQGRVTDGEVLVRQAIERTETTDALNMQADALMDLGELLHPTGRSAEADSTFQRAEELYQRKGNAVSARKAASLLGRVR